MKKLYLAILLLLPLAATLAGVIHFLPGWQENNALVPFTEDTTIPKQDSTKLPAMVATPEDAKALIAPNPAAIEELFNRSLFQFIGQFPPLVVVDSSRIPSLKRLNNLVQLPAFSTTTLFNPSTLTQIGDPHPGEGIVTMAPTRPNHKGDAITQFPLEIPKGRNGLQPHLTIKYNSGGNNGWMGLGWDLGLPSITIDTRWGVPRYDMAFESETYLLEEEQLFPITHREQWQPRTSEKVFHKRIEGDFLKMVRHGDNPKNYWWEITDKMGLRHSYGGLQGSGVLSEAVLTDDTGNIGHWALVETRDLHQNFIRYHYHLQDNTGSDSLAFPGIQLYADSITYTGHGEVEGNYVVRFQRDRQLQEPLRPDVMVDARLGFVKTTADRLRQIEVRFMDRPVRSYEFRYDTGAFYKTLLSSIAVFDKNGQEFYTHEMTYFDEVRQGNTYQVYAPAASWSSPADSLDEPATLIGSAASHSTQEAFSVTVGQSPPKFVSTKRQTLGGHFGYSSMESLSSNALVDIDGDVLPDKVFIYQDSLYYRKNQGGASASFAERQKISGINQLGRIVRTSENQGMQAHPEQGFFGYNETRSVDSIMAYFADFNGDGLVDIASNGQIYFNHLDASGNPVFEPTSAATPNPVSTGAFLHPAIYTQDSTLPERLVDRYPLHDVVRLWVAPCEGLVNLSAPVVLIQPQTPNENADGVIVSIQHNNTLIWIDTIPAGDFEVRTPEFSNLEVEEADRFLFRVQSIYNGDDDLVSWDPFFTYQTFLANEMDANGKFNFQYKASQDFIVTAPQNMEALDNGTIEITTEFSKPTTSDDIQLLILKITPANDTIAVVDSIYGWQDSLQTNFISTVDVEAGDRLGFFLVSNTNIDWSVVRWIPQFRYINSDNPLLVGFPFYPSVDYFMFNKLLNKPRAWSVNFGQRIGVSPSIQAPQAATGPVTISVKGVNRWFGEITFNIVNGEVPDVTLFVQVPELDSLFFDYHIEDPVLADALTLESVEVLLSNGDLFDVDAGVYTTLLDQDKIFGPLYRGWGQFIYNGNRERAASPISLESLRLDTAGMRQNVNLLPTITAPEQLAGLYNPVTSTFLPMLPDPFMNRWQGIDSQTFLKADTISSSRLGKQELFFPAIDSSALAPIKIAFSVEQSTAGAAIADSIAGKSTIVLENVLDGFDLNGDLYPEVVGKKFIQYSRPQGGLLSSLAAYGLEAHKVMATSQGVTSGGVFVSAKPNNTGITTGHGASHEITHLNAIQDKIGHNANIASVTGNEAIALIDSFNTSLDTTQHSWLDVNGDGLPDKVFQNDSIALNLGYRFLEKRPWGFGIFRNGITRDTALGGAFNYYNMSWSWGLSLSESINYATKSMQDMNGDGLIDLLLPGDTLKIALNLGAGFSAPIPWASFGKLEEGKSAGQTNSTAMTRSAYIAPDFTLNYNPQSFSGSGASAQLSRIIDMDGDGYPDLVFSNNETTLQYQRSIIGKTNLLQSVQQPMGASFSLDYELLGPSFDMPQAKWVLSTATLQDGFPGDGVDSLTTIYKYEQGVADRRERAFYGFGQINVQRFGNATTDVPFEQRAYVFDNTGFHRQGLLLKESIMDADGNIYFELSYNYVLKDILTGEDFPDDFPEAPTSAAFPALVSMQKTSLDTSGFQSNVSFTYDLSGNVLQWKDTGDGTELDQLTATITYHNVETPYLKGIAATFEMTNADTLLRKRMNSIDDRGNVNQVKLFYLAEASSDYDFEYDEFGNLTKLTKPINAKQERLFYAYTYDDTIHTYVQSIRDGYGYGSEMVTDLVFGKPLKINDINNQLLQYHYDDRGRVDTIVGPFEVLQDRPFTLAFDYHPEAVVPYTRTIRFDPEYDSTSLRSFVFADGLGKILQTQKTGSFFTKPGEEDELGLIVSGRVFFDAFGRISKAYSLQKSPMDSAGAFLHGLPSTNPTETTFDFLGRPLSITRPDGATSQMTYTVAEDNTGLRAFLTSTADWLGNVSETYTDLKGRTRSLKLVGPEGDIWTNYSYNAASDLIKIADNAGNNTSLRYDLAGRLISENHPDAGLTTFAYDPANNLLVKVTSTIREMAQEGAIHYTYEKERLIGIDYPQNFQNKVQLHYGDTSAQHNRRGRIWLQEDASGGQEFFYDAIGQETKNIRTVLITESNVRTFVSQYVYDTWQRLQTIDYPDAEKVDYLYNRSGGLLAFDGEKESRIYPYLEQLGYDEFGNTVYEKAGNGDFSIYTYEPFLHRLTGIETQNDQARKLQVMGLEYDAVGNLLSVSNQSKSDPLQLGGPSHYQYQYDNLYRLTGAQGRWQGFNRRDSFELAIRYDNLYNIIHKTQKHWRDTVAQAETTYDDAYEYGGPQPHIPTQVGSRLYTFDNNGNQLHWRGKNYFRFRQNLFDEENRLTGVSNDGYLSRYTFDAFGRRAVKSHGGVQGVFIDGAPAGVINHQKNYTAFISPYLEAGDLHFTKHYFAGDKRIASKRGTGNFYNQFWFQAGITAGNRNYTRRIQLLQRAANQHYQSLAIAPGPPTLPGYYGQPNYNGQPLPDFALDSSYILAPKGWPQPPKQPVPGSTPGSPTLPYNNILTADSVKAGYGYFSGQPFNIEGNQFFYHYNYQGGVNLVSDINGQVRQHLEYTPLGETLVHEYTNDDRQNFQLLGREWDDEAGLHYIGAGFYDARIGLWTGLDVSRKYCLLWRGRSPYYWGKWY